MRMYLLTVRWRGNKHILLYLLGNGFENCLNLKWKTIKAFNDTVGNETLGGSSSGFFSEILYAMMKAKNVSTFPVLPRRQVIYSVHV